MKKNILITAILVMGLTAFAQENPPLVNISQFIYGGTPDVGESKMIGKIYDSERKHVLLNVSCKNYKDDYGWLFTSYTIYNYDDVNEHITIPVRSEYAYHGYTVWYRTAELILPDNVRRVDAEPGYLYKVSLTIGKNSQIEEIHIPQSVTNLTIKVAKEYQGDVVFYMESNYPKFKDGFVQSYYEPDYKKCVFIVPKGSVERYKSIGRFQYARIYESIEYYRTTRLNASTTPSANSRISAQTYSVSIPDGYNAQSNDFVITEEFTNNINKLNPNYIGSFSEGLSAIQIDGKMGYIDKKGEICIPLHFNDAGEFREGYARIRKVGSSNLGFIDKTGNMAIPAVFDGGGYVDMFFQEGLAKVLKDGKWGFINTNGNMVFTTMYDLHTSVFHNGLVLANTEEKIYGSNMKNRLYGFLGSDGRIVIPMKFDKAGEFHDGLAKVLENGKWGFINKNGNRIIPPIYELARDFSDGLAAVKKNGKWLFVNKRGDVVISTNYETVEDFSEGLVAVCKNGKWGFIDKNGNVVVPIKFDYVRAYQEGMAVVSEMDEYGNCSNYGLINVKGDIIIPMQYDWIPNGFQEGLAVVKKDDRWGFVDKYGHSTLDFKTSNNK